MAKKPNRRLIRALADKIADDVIASHEAGHPERPRLPKEFYEEELKKEAPKKSKRKKGTS